MITIIGAGLAGSEAAYQCAKRGVAVTLYEQRPGAQTEAHQTGDFAELVCSNSLKSSEPTNAHGLLKAELELLDSLLLRIARLTRIPGGKALVVDRALFARKVTEALSHLPEVTIRRQEIKTIPDSGTVIIASGPLTSAALADELAHFLGTENLSFYDAISPIVSADTVDRARSFAANRYIAGDDYANCPLTEQEYDAFYDALVHAELFPLHDFESATPSTIPHSAFRIPHCFEGCMPIEDIARRGKQALLFGPMKPVGLVDPLTVRQPFAVVQLRRENATGTMYNLVGFQTRMTQPEQRRVLRMIPALAHAEFLRYGSVHRNTFINAPSCLRPTLQLAGRVRPLPEGSLRGLTLSERLFIAGQLSGVEGYVESIATGLLAGINAVRQADSAALLVPSENTVLGGLLKYITTARRRFQPMNANFGLLPVPQARKRDRPRVYSERALAAMREFADVVNQV